MAKKDITNTDLVKIEPITDNQKIVFDSYAKGQHQFMFGSAGTGKTFISLYLALSEVLRDDTKYDKVVLVRSLIPTREIGFLPGNLVSKMDPWTRPILDIFTEFYSMSDVTNFLKCGVLEIAPLAFMRGRTFHNTFVLADEMQNSSPSQMMMLTTRMGKDSKLVLTGDLAQSDRVVKGTGSYSTSNGLQDFFDKLENHRKYVGDEYALRDIGLISMNTQDVKRSTLVSHILEIYGERSEPILIDLYKYISPKFIKIEYFVTFVPENNRKIVKQIKTKFLKMLE